jgi:hypothetical protein
MGVSKQYRSELIKNIIEQFKRLGLSDKTIGFFIRAYHVNMPIYFFIIMLYGSFYANVGLIAFLLCALVSFIAFDGCILSRIESELDNDDITVVDPLLEFAGLEKTHKTRIQVSYLIAGMYLAMTFLIFWFRFINKGISSPLTPNEGVLFPLTPQGILSPLTPNEGVLFPLTPQGISSGVVASE